MVPITISRPRAFDAASKSSTQKPSPKSKSNDWKTCLLNDGYAVIKKAIPQHRALSYQQRAYDWLRSFNTDLDFLEPSTWIKSNLPVQTRINTFASYAVAHERFMWEARMEPGVLDAFASIWGTDELLASFDSLNVTFPNRKDVPRKPSWEHVDQSPLRRGFQCCQGVISLSISGPEDGGLVVYPGSQLLTEEFFDTQTDKTTWNSLDRYMFDRDQLSWFTNRGIQPLKVCCEVGDLILWDGRTIHFGSEPSPASNRIRTALYVAYTPATFASKEALKMKAEVFANFEGTNHWPHDNIVRRPNEAYLEDGRRDPRSRKRPRELPVISDGLLKLAGVTPY